MYTPHSFVCSFIRSSIHLHLNFLDFSPFPTFSYILYENKNIFLNQLNLFSYFRGCVPPLWGSGIYRSTQFAVFEAV
jgi:hypothetical protein